MNDLFVLEDVGRDKTLVKILEVNEDSIDSANKILNFNKNDYISNAFNFDGSYKPDENECLKIESFELPVEVSRAIRNPLGVEKLDAKTKNKLNIRAIFSPLEAGSADKVIFQRIHKNQILMSHQLSLIWDKNTFVPIKKPGIVISQKIDAYYESKTLYFKSYYWAKQIFNLDKYYREATDTDIKNFLEHKYFEVDDKDTIISNCNNWSRKKIAYILDSKVLEVNSYSNIMQAADKLKLDLETTDEQKIIYPKDKKKQKRLLSFLSDEIYRGGLTNKLFITNSKRNIK